LREKHIIKETGNKGKGLYSTKKYCNGDLVLNLEGNILPYPTRTSIQVGEDKHLESWEGGHVNHHCSPNTKVISVKVFEINDYFLVAIKDIEIGEQITFDYETTETEMAEPFKCSCHGRWISGAFENDIEE